ncbi:lipase [Novymonas esmeraldas]|uniref:Lipase n=1 Tax=Novymonas esmeraldas TaxID=1808958 RepID=A0AAW0EUV9_9TRYP
MRRVVVAVVAFAAVLLACAGLGAAQLQPYVYKDAYRSHIFARASYCRSSSLVGWSCGFICNTVPGFRTDTTVESDDLDAFGFIGVDDANRQIVVAFRGTSTATNWLQNIKYFRTPYTISSSCGAACEVHRGFFSTYLSVRPQVNMAVMRLIGLLPGYQVLVTGHSLGGAMAMLAAVDLQEQFNKMWAPQQPVVLYTFGAPRVGNPAFAKWAAGLLAKGPHYRVTHARDPVPHLPPMSFGFLHTPTEVFYRTTDNSSMRVCADSATAESEDCSNDLWAVGISDHLTYLGEDTGCSCSTCPSARMANLNGEAEATMPAHLYARLTWEYSKSRVGL